MSNPPDSINIVDVVGLLNRRKWIVLGITFVGCVGVFLFSMISILLPPEKTYLPNYFIPEACVIINEASGNGTAEMLKASGLGSLTGLAGLAASGPTASGLAIRIATTDYFIDRVADEFDFFTLYNLAKSQFPKTAARRIIRKSLNLNYTLESGMLTIGYKSTDRELATRIVNRVIELLEEEFVRISIDKNRTQLNLVTKKLDEVEKELGRLQHELADLQGNYNNYDIAVLAKEQAERLASLRAELVKKTIEIDSYTRAYPIEDPVLNKLKMERDALKVSIEKFERGYREKQIVIPSETELPVLVAKYSRIKGDIDIQKKIYETLIQQQELLQLQVESVPPTLQVYSWAMVPERKAGPNRPKICLIVGGASFFISIIIAFILDYFARVLKDPKKRRRIKGVADES